MYTECNIEDEKVQLNSALSLPWLVFIINLGFGGCGGGFFCGVCFGVLVTMRPSVVSMKKDVTDKSIKSNSHLHPHIYKISEFVFLKPLSYVTKRFNAFLEKRKGIQKGFSDSI